MASHKSWIQVRAEYALAYALMQVMQRSPLTVASSVASAAARLMDVCIPKLRHVGEINLRLAMPELDRHERKRIIDGTFSGVGRLLLALARAPLINRRNVSDWISYEGLEHYQLAKQGGRGILVATAHLGNWELSAISHALMTEPMSVMVRPLDNPLIDDLVEQRRMSSGNDLIYKKDAARSVLKALKANRAVGILLDQNASASEGVFVDFFGRKVCASSAFVKFAYHSGARVIPGCALWVEEQQRYVLRFYPEIPMSGEVVEDTQRIHSFLEQLILQHPEQWMWIHRKWKTRPPGEAPIY